MSVVMRVVARGRTGEEPRQPTWVEAYDPEAFDGRGYVKLTETLAEALQFDDHAAAMTVWRTIPTCRPVRPDGKPNRPLTSYTVEIHPLEEPSS